jgi:1-acyl-sn-glycerol-3-phosphate acyltransferase
VTTTPISRGARFVLRRYVASAWLYASDEIDPTRPCIVVALHQSALDLATAMVATEALDRRFAVWAHPDILSIAPFLRSADLLEAPSDPEGFRDLIARSREILRGPDPAALWIFPQGGFFHRSAEVEVHPGIRMLRRACPDVPVVVAGIDYSLYRAGRPHCVVELRPLHDPDGDLGPILTAANERAARRAAEDLPELAPPRVPLVDLARIPNRWRRQWTLAAFGS